MKRFLILLSILFCNTVWADTINLHWLNYDGTSYSDSTCVIDSDLILPATAPTRYGYTFTGWKIQNYIPTKYLESTGTQYINLRIPATYGYKYSIKFEFTQISNSSNYLFGSLTTNNGIFCGTENSDHNFVMRTLSQSDKIIDTVHAQINTVYIIDFLLSPGNNTINIKNASGTTVSNMTTRSSGTLNLYNFYLFGINFNDNFYSSSNIRVYYFKIYNGDVLLHDFIPVLDLTGTPCLYDRVTEEFYYNQGTGQFIAGPAL